MQKKSLPCYEEQKSLSLKMQLLKMYNSLVLPHFTYSVRQFGIMRTLRILISSI